MGHETNIGIFKLMNIQPLNYEHNNFFYVHPLEDNNHGYDSNNLPAIVLRFGPNYGNIHYASLGPATAQVPRGYIGAFPLISARLGLHENDEIIISVCDAASITSAFVRPKSDNDYRILANLQNSMENVILNQIRIVAPNQIITIKLGNIVVDLHTAKILPNNKCGRLEKFTELVIIEKLENSTIDSAPNASSTITSHHNFSNYFRSMFNWMPWSSPGITSDVKQPMNTTSGLLRSALVDYSPLEFRVIKSSSSDVETIFTNFGFKTDDVTPCKICNTLEKTNLSLRDSQAAKPLSIFVNVKTHKRETNNETDYEIYLPLLLMKQLNVHVGSRVSVTEVTALPEVGSKETVKQAETKLESVLFFEEKPIIWKSLEGIYDHLNKVINANFEHRLSSNILISAPTGSGKSYVIRALVQSCNEKNFYHKILDCKSLRGKKIETLLKIISTNLSECSCSEPAVLFLDDIDALMFETEEDAGDKAMSMAYCSRWASLLTELTRNFQTMSRVCLVATALSLSNLSSAFSNSRGPRLFDLVVNIPELTFDERKELIVRFGGTASDEIVNSTHGYRVQDLKDLISRAKLKSLISGKAAITTCDIESALEDTVPMSLLGVQLQKDVPYKWSDVGGLSSVKTVLEEIFRWPSQFPQVFASSPLRLQAGALLFGPPGCGKTLVAGALANECGMNFMSVKGPELLSKYVGASEAAVRNLFERALMAQPCLLFFDELDSLAPRRGHDSTGVTDRVVNQLLTQLDGVESRTGVWVLGASSRPDLIDPALLRPGRLDRTIYCAPPDANDRFEILTTLANGVLLSENLDFRAVALKTEHFTGADLQALLYSAHIKAVQDPENISPEKVTVNGRHIDASLLESRPSLPPTERLKFDKIYRKFLNGKLDPEPLSQKVTFA